MDLRPLTVQTSSAMSVCSLATTVIISSRDNTLPFPSLQDCQVSPVAVGFGRRLAAMLRQAGSCSFHHSLMTLIENLLFSLWNLVTWGHSHTFTSYRYTVCFFFKRSSYLETQKIPKGVKQSTARLVFLFSPSGQGQLAKPNWGSYEAQDLLPDDLEAGHKRGANRADSS